MIGLGTTNGATNMMMQTFMAIIAFSIGLLAFCAGTWMTIWAGSSNQVADVVAAKMAGYFITILALITLVFTSYYIAVGVINSEPASFAHWSGPTMKHQSLMHKDAHEHNKQ